MANTTRIPVKKTFGGFAAECVCGSRIFRYNRAAAEKAKIDHFKRDHRTRWMKGRIQ